MRIWKIIALVAVAAVTVSLIGTSAAYAMMGSYNYGNNYSYSPNNGGGNNFFRNLFGNIFGRGGHMGGGYNNGYYGNGYGGMMGGDGYGNGYYNQGTAPYQNGYPSQFGGGCHRGTNYDTTPAYIPTGAPLNITTALTIAQNYLTSTGNPDLAVAEVEEYANNFYVQVGEKSTGNGAFELIIDKYTDAVYPEMGPNMMWNTKYGMMHTGIRGGIFGTPTTNSTITATQAAANAQQFLTSAIPGTTTGDVTTFYGYYTIEVLNSNGTVYGMLSVNSYNGQVWFHTWHGTFVQEVDVS